MTATTDAPACAAPGCSGAVPPARTRPRRFCSPACKRASEAAARRTVRAVERGSRLIPYSPPPGRRPAFVDVDPAALREVLVEDLEAQGLDGYSLVLMGDLDTADDAAAAIEAACAERAASVMVRRPFQEVGDPPPRPALGWDEAGEYLRQEGLPVGAEERRVLMESLAAERRARRGGEGAEGAGRRGHRCAPGEQGRSGRRPTRRGPVPAFDDDAGAAGWHVETRLPQSERRPHLHADPTPEQTAETFRLLRDDVPPGVLGEG